MEGVVPLNSEKNRASLVAVVAAYLLYLAYQLFEARLDTDTTMTPTVRFLCIGLFVLAAIGLFVYAIHTWRHSTQEEEDEQRKRDEHTMK